MSKRQSDSSRAVEQLLRQVLGRKGGPIVLGVLIIAAVVVWLVTRETEKPTPPNGQPRAVPGEGYHFCFWNVENLFDDVDDDRREVDERYDNQFAGNPKLLDEKLGNLSKVLLAMNGGRGPDVLAFAEVENERAADLLRQRLNRDLGGRSEPYQHILFKENRVGRNIATGVLTRLPVLADRTQKLDGRRRILEGRLVVNGHELVIVASHWTSRLRQDDGTNGEPDRARYADKVYDQFHAMFKTNPAVDFLACGDFNDDPDNVSVTEHLHAGRSRDNLTAGAEPSLYNLFGVRWAANRHQFGTLFYDRKWNLFDQIVVSPGMLDEKGWSVVEGSIAIEGDNMKRPDGRPWRFDDAIDGKHGIADHFPVSVRLKVAEK